MDNQQQSTYNQRSILRPWQAAVIRFMLCSLLEMVPEEQRDSAKGIINECMSQIFYHFTLEGPTANPSVPPPEPPLCVVLPTRRLTTIIERIPNPFLDLPVRTDDEETINEGDYVHDDDSTNASETTVDISDGDDDYVAEIQSPERPHRQLRSQGNVLRTPSPHPEPEDPQPEQPSHDSQPEPVPEENVVQEEQEEEEEEVVDVARVRVRSLRDQEILSYLDALKDTLVDRPDEFDNFTAPTTIEECQHQMLLLEVAHAHTRLRAIRINYNRGVVIFAFKEIAENTPGLSNQGWKSQARTILNISLSVLNKVIRLYQHCNRYPKIFKLPISFRDFNDNVRKFE